MFSQLTSSPDGVGTFHRIVVGYDDTAQGRDALLLGELLARTTGDELLVVRVEPTRPEPSEGAKRLSAELATLLGAAEVPVNSRLLVGGSPARTMHELGEADPRIGLIVLGSTHRAGLGRVMPGSVAERLLNGAPCCIAVAPRGFAHVASRSAATSRTETPRRAPGGEALALAEELRVIAVGFDGSPEASGALELAARLGKLAVATLRVITVHHRGLTAGEPPPITTPEEEGGAADLETLLHTTVAALPSELRALPVSERGDPAGRLLARAEEGVDLLVVGSRDYGPLRAVLLGGVSSTLLRNAPCPVLITPRSSAPR